MEQKIKSIEKGWGEGSIFYSTNPKVVEQYQVDEITEGSKQISNDNMINIYRGYKDGKLIFEIAAGINVTVIYE